MDECRLAKPSTPYGELRSTEGSCDWIKKVAQVWGGCNVCIDHEERGFYLTSCDSIDIQAYPITYCPGCGRKLVLG